MSHHSGGMASKRGRSVERYAEQIRAYLAKCDGPRSVFAINAATGIPAKKIRAAISQMISHRGGLQAVNSANRHVLYANVDWKPMTSPQPKSKGPYAEAGKIKIGRGSVWGASLV